MLGSRSMMVFPEFFFRGRGGGFQNHKSFFDHRFSARNGGSMKETRWQQPRLQALKMGRSTSTRPPPKEPKEPVVRAIPICTAFGTNCSTRTCPRAAKLDMMTAFLIAGKLQLQQPLRERKV